MSLSSNTLEASRSPATGSRAPQRFDQYLGGVTIISNTITGSSNVTGNTGGTTFTYNTVDGSLNITGNWPRSPTSTTPSTARSITQATDGCFRTCRRSASR